VKAHAKPLVSIVVPSRNGWWLLDRNLPFLLAAVQEVGSGEVVVVDDGSEDATATHLAESPPELRLVQRHRQGGFPVAANHGVQAARGEYIFLVNNDVVVPRGVVGTLLEELRDPKVFAVVPGISRTSTEVDESRTRLFFRRGLVVTTFWAGEQEPDYACGAAMCCRRSDFLALGGFDPLYVPFYWEDVDLSYRARKRGFLVKRVKEATVFHAHSQTIGAIKDRSFVQKVYERNRIFFMWKNLTDPALWKRHLAWLPVKVVWDLIVYRDFVYGLAGALKGLGDVARARLREKSESVLTDSQLLRVGR